MILAFFYIIGVNYDYEYKTRCFEFQTKPMVITSAEGRENFQILLYCVPAIQNGSSIPKMTNKPSEKSVYKTELK